MLKATNEQPDTIRPGVIVRDEYGNEATVYPPGWMYMLAFAIRGVPWAIKEIESGKYDGLISQGAFI